MTNVLRPRRQCWVVVVVVHVLGVFLSCALDATAASSSSSRAKHSLRLGHSQDYRDSSEEEEPIPPYYDVEVTETKFRDGRMSTTTTRTSTLPKKDDRWDPIPTATIAGQRQRALQNDDDDDFVDDDDDDEDNVKDDRNYVNDVFHCTNPHELPVNDPTVSCDEDTNLWNLSDLNPEHAPLYCYDYFFNDDPSDRTGTQFDIETMVDEKMEPCFLWNSLYGSPADASSNKDININDIAVSTTSPPTPPPTGTPMVLIFDKEGQQIPQKEETVLNAELEATLGENSTVTDHVVVLPAAGDDDDEDHKVSIVPVVVTQEFSTLMISYYIAHSSSTSTLQTSMENGNGNRQLLQQPKKQPQQRFLRNGKPSSSMARNHRRLVNLDRNQLSEITAQHLLDELQKTLGRGSVVGLDLVMTSVQAQVLTNMTIVATEAISGRLLISQPRLDIDSIIQQAFEDNALKKYLHLINTASSTSALTNIINNNNYPTAASSPSNDVFKRITYIQLGIPFTNNNNNINNHNHNNGAGNNNPSSSSRGRDRTNILGLDLTDMTTVAIGCGIIVTTVVIVLFICIFCLLRSDRFNNVDDEDDLNNAKSGMDIDHNIVGNDHDDYDNNNAHFPRGVIAHPNPSPGDTTSDLGSNIDSANGGSAGHYARSEATSVYSYIEPTNGGLDDQTCSIAPSFLYGNDNLGLYLPDYDDNGSLQSRTALWSVVDGIEGNNTSNNDTAHNASSNSNIGSPASAYTYNELSPTNYSYCSTNNSSLYNINNKSSAASGGSGQRISSSNSNKNRSAKLPMTPSNMLITTQQHQNQLSNNKNVMIFSDEDDESVSNSYIMGVGKSIQNTKPESSSLAVVDNNDKKTAVDLSTPAKEEDTKSGKKNKKHKKSKSWLMGITSKVKSSSKVNSNKNNDNNPVDDPNTNKKSSDDGNNHVESNNIHHSIVENNMDTIAISQSGSNKMDNNSINNGNHNAIEAEKDVKGNNAEHIENTTTAITTINTVTAATIDNNVIIKTATGKKELNDLSEQQQSHASICGSTGTVSTFTTPIQPNRIIIIDDTKSIVSKEEVGGTGGGESVSTHGDYSSIATAKAGVGGAKTSSIVVASSSSVSSWKKKHSQQRRVPFEKRYGVDNGAIKSVRPSKSTLRMKYSMDAIGTAPSDELCAISTDDSAVREHINDSNNHQIQKHHLDAGTEEQKNNGPNSNKKVNVSTNPFDDSVIIEEEEELRRKGQQQDFDAIYDDENSTDNYSHSYNVNTPNDKRCREDRDDSDREVNHKDKRIAVSGAVSSGLSVASASPLTTRSNGSISNCSSENRNYNNSASKDTNTHNRSVLGETSVFSFTNSQNNNTSFISTGSSNTNTTPSKMFNSISNNTSLISNKTNGSSINPYYDNNNSRFLDENNNIKNKSKNELSVTPASVSTMDSNNIYTFASF